jgi:hypothetical protein
MGETRKYHCQNCGYDIQYCSGQSGLTGQPTRAYVCDKTKEVVHVSVESVNFVLFGPPRSNVEDNFPMNPLCPVCKDHNLGKEWFGGACPKCGEFNSSIGVGNWD